MEKVGLNAEAGRASPELVADLHCVLGEAPLWHPDENRLYWLDIPQGRLLRFDPATGNAEQILEADAIGGFTIQADGGLLLFMAEGAVSLWQHGRLREVLPPRPEFHGQRFNDVIAEPSGCVLCGLIAEAGRPKKRESNKGLERLATRGRRRLRRLVRRFVPDRPTGGLFRLDRQGNLTQLLDDIGLANGLAFSPDRSRLYFADSSKSEILVFDYEPETGQLSHRRLFATVPSGEGQPDGLTVDAAGHVWSARWDGACLVRYDPSGQIERKIEVPVRKVTSLTFAGRDWRDLYVTTAGGDDRHHQGASAGGLFRLAPGIVGLPEFRSNVTV